MEMLDEKTLVKAGVIGFGGVALSLVVWILTTLIEVDKRTAVIVVKVESNHKMLTPLWEDYVRRQRNGDVAWFDEAANIQASTEEKMDQGS
jgi:hypothetical protein